MHENHVFQKAMMRAIEHNSERPIQQVIEQLVERAGDGSTERAFVRTTFEVLYNIET